MFHSKEILLPQFSVLCIFFMLLFSPSIHCFLGLSFLLLPTAFHYTLFIFEFFFSFISYPLEMPKLSQSHFSTTLIIVGWTFICCLIFRFLTFPFLNFLPALHQKSISVALFIFCLVSFKCLGLCTTHTYAQAYIFANAN